MSFFATFAVLLVLASPTLIVLNSFCENFSRPTVEEHAFVVMVVILVSNLLLSVRVSFPQLLIHNLLDLQTEKKEEN